MVKKLLDEGAVSLVDGCRARQDVIGVVIAALKATGIEALELYFIESYL